MGAFLLFLTALSSAVLIVEPCAAQRQDSLMVAQRQDSLLAAMREAYQELDYDQVRSRAGAVLAYYDQLTTEQLLEVHTTLAVVSYATGDEPEARRHFEAALTLSPNLQLDPINFSPKVLAFFDEVKAARRPPPQPEESPPAVRYVALSDPIPQAALRSVVVPGWGQLYKGHRTRGRVLVGAWAASVAGVALSHAQYRAAYNAYGEGATPAEAEGLYDRYNTWYKVRNNVALGAAGIWLYSYLDALLARVPAAQIPVAEEAQASLSPSRTGPGLALRLAF